MHGEDAIAELGEGSNFQVHGIRIGIWANSELTRTVRYRAVCVEPCL